ncbi:unnamed protein product [Onchocerca flexuosa]|uniref:Transcriptional regulator n=1 Tax=Onchocerca flexuosa TaxID=387005 RepID=A0A183I146_9BILA|nr:unnamed protein product [Onchocerca flexuosa]
MFRYEHEMAQIISEDQKMENVAQLLKSNVGKCYRKKVFKFLKKQSYTDCMKS